MPTQCICFAPARPAVAPYQFIPKSDEPVVRERLRSCQRARRARLPGRSGHARPWRRSRARPRCRVGSRRRTWSGCRCGTAGSGGCGSWRWRRLCWCRCRWLVGEGTAELRRTPNAALKSASGNVHDVETLHGRGRIKVENYSNIVKDHVTVRRGSINHEIGGLDTARIRRIAQVIRKIHRLRVDHAATTWVSDDHKTNRRCWRRAWRHSRS